MSHAAPAPVDELLPWRRLFVFGLQHVLVMAASPIASVFLMSKALNFPPALAVQLLSATFVICGLGTLLQSLGMEVRFHRVASRIAMLVFLAGFLLVARRLKVADRISGRQGEVLFPLEIGR